MSRLAVFALSTAAALAPPVVSGSARGGEFKRVVYQAEFELGEEAPGVAVEGRVMAHAAGSEIVFVNLDTGQVIVRRSVIPKTTKTGGKAFVKILGMSGGKVYAWVRYFTGRDHPDPKGEWAVVFREGHEPGTCEVISVSAEQEDAAHIMQLHPRVEVADRLLGTSLVYEDKGVLHIAPLEGQDPAKKFKLKGQPRWRPVVRSGQVSGLCEASVYFYRPGEAAPLELAFRGTALSFMAEQATAWTFFERSAEIVVASTGKDTAACDPAGKLLWKLPMRGRLCVGPAGELISIGHSLYSGRGSISRLDPKTGRILWRRCLAPAAMYGGAGPVHPGGAEIVDGRIVIVSHGSVRALDPKATGCVTVIDPADGRVLVDTPHYGHRLQRKSYLDGIPLTHLAADGDFLAVGFEDCAYAVNITPTAKVPAALQAGDPANAGAAIQAFYAKHGARAIPGFDLLPVWGGNMADTPEAARLIDKPLRMLVGGQQGPVRPEMVAAFCWMKDPMILQSMRLYMKGGKGQDYNQAMALVNMISCHADAGAAVAALKEIVADQAYTAHVREAAADYLRCLREPAAASPQEADLAKLIYGGDNVKAVAELRRRLRAADAAGRAKLLEAIKAAPDEVIVALAGDLSSLPGGSEMVAGARKRLKAIGQ